MITTDEAVTRLQMTASAIIVLVSDLNDEQVRQRPTSEAWSPLEVICHLVDEEREDFRPRIDFILHPSDALPAPIAPQQWVTERAYNTRNLVKMIERFRAERAQSIAWLQSLSSSNWGQRLNHPPLPELVAGDLLASWVAHDLLHLRQLIELRYALVRAESAPYSIDYAGEW